MSYRHQDQSDTQSDEQAGGYLINQKPDSHAYQETCGDEDSARLPSSLLSFILLGHSLCLLHRVRCWLRPHDPPQDHTWILTEADDFGIGPLLAPPTSRWLPSRCRLGR